MVYAAGMSLLLVAGVLFYWRYLHNLSHVSPQTLRRIAATAKAVPKPLPVYGPAAPVVAVPNIPVAAPLPIAATRVTPAVPEAKTLPIVAAPSLPVTPEPVKTVVKMTAPPMSVAISRPVVKTPPPRPLTEADRLVQAGRQAFNTVIDAAYVYPDAYGFRPEDTLRMARLGEPVQIFQVAETDRVNYQAGQPVRPILKPMERWAFPVYMGDQVRCMVQVSHTDRGFIPGDGSRMLGSAWNKILARWPAAQGYHPQLVIHPPIPCYYFTVPELPEQTMTDVNQMNFSDKPNLSPAAVILASWR